MILAIFGGGSIGQRHARNLRALGHSVHLYDTDPTRGGDPSRFVPGLVQAVLICTPASTHEDVAHDLLQAGYRGPLFVEKPLTLSKRASIFKAWPHPVTMVGYNWRFHPELAPLKAFAQKGATFHFDCRTDMRTWPGAEYDDPLLECSHELDLAINWLGDPTSVQGGSLDGGGAWVQMLHPRGDSLIDLRWRTEPARCLTVHLPGMTTLYATSRMPLGQESPALTQSYVAQLQHFLDSVKTRTPTSTPFADGLRVVEICQRVKELAA